MASKQIRCEMCRNENAVGYCKTCGDVGETCVNIHKIGKMFQTHTIIMHEAVKMHEDGSENPEVILCDITEEKCKQHPSEKAIFLCNIHDSMICGRCLHSGHRPCVEEVVDLLYEVVNIDCEKVNTMKSMLKEVKDEILLLKDEAEQSNESYKKNADRCMQECMELGNTIKRRVDELTSDIIHEITKTRERNVSTHSSITQTCIEKTKWCDNEENKIDDFFDNNLAGHLYLMHRSFEKKVSDARSHLKEIKHKHTFKGCEFKENKVILNCLFEDLEEVCEQQEEFTGSDDGNSNDVCVSSSKINKTRRELTALLNQLEQDLDKSEKARNALCDELKQVKQDRDNSEKKRKIFEQELQKAKHNIEESVKTRNTLCDELKQVKKDKDNSEKKRKTLEHEVQKAEQDIEELKKTRNVLSDELKQVKQDNDNSEKKRKILEQELLKSKKDIEESVKTRKGFEQESLKAKQCIEKYEKEGAEVKAQFSQIKDNIKWTQPTGTVKIDTCSEKGWPIINLVFTFPNGIQTTYHVSPGKPYKGGTFTGRLCNDAEGMRLCRMLKVAFRKGLMFNFGKEGKVFLDGFTLYNGSMYDLTFEYAKYMSTLRADLAAKGITKAIIDQTEKLEETFAVDGLSLLEAARSS